jgi:hypothetical protein
MPYLITPSEIHVGPGFLWVDITVPAYGSRLVIDADGFPTVGSPYGMGPGDGHATFHASATEELIRADQITAPIDKVMTAEIAYIEFSLKSSAFTKLIKFLGHASYTAGTDGTLPAGAQVYEELTFGGLIAYPSRGVAVISPIRGYSSPGKYEVAVLYSTKGVSVLERQYTRTKEVIVKGRFDGLADTTRTAGDQVGSVYRQL